MKTCCGCTRSSPAGHGPGGSGALPDDARPGGPYVPPPPEWCRGSCASCWSGGTRNRRRCRRCSARRSSTTNSRRSTRSPTATAEPGAHSRCGSSTGADSIRTNFLGGRDHWEDRPRYYAALQAVQQQGEDLTAWLEYCAEGLQQTLERVWQRIQQFSAWSRKAEGRAAPEAGAVAAAAARAREPEPARDLGRRGRFPSRARWT